MYINHHKDTLFIKKKKKNKEKKKKEIQNLKIEEK
jgi:hypothetical protein